MQSNLQREGRTTFDEFLEIIDDGQKADLLDGAIYMASPDSVENNDLNTWLCSVLSLFVETKGLGKVYVSRVAYRLGKKRGPEPDLGFVTKKMLKKRRRGYIDGPPALAVEIVSADSVQRDYLQKRAVYEAAGVQEYWILDPDEKRATFLTWKKGRFEEMPLKDGVFHSKVVPGFYLPVDWIWEETRPSGYSFLRELLGDE